MAVSINEGNCIGCGICVDECPQDALTVDGVVQVDEGACIECGICVDACPQEVLSL